MSNHHKCNYNCLHEDLSNYGHICRESVTNFTGTVVYAKSSNKCENGTALQITRGCEEQDTISTSGFASVGSPTPCETLHLCHNWDWWIQF